MTERDIELAEQAGLVRGLNQPFDSAQSKFAELTRADEREACAKFFENHWREEWTDEQIAEAIRARGNT